MFHYMFEVKTWCSLILLLSSENNLVNCGAILHLLADVSTAVSFSLSDSFMAPDCPVINNACAESDTAAV